jgi:hypothetical protein
MGLSLRSPTECWASLTPALQRENGWVLVIVHSIVGSARPHDMS